MTLAAHHLQTAQAEFYMTLLTAKEASNSIHSDRSKPGILGENLPSADPKERSVGLNFIGDCRSLLVLTSLKNAGLDLTPIVASGSAEHTLFLPYSGSHGQRTVDSINLKI